MDDTAPQLPDPAPHDADQPAIIAALVLGLGGFAALLIAAALVLVLSLFGGETLPGQIGTTATALVTIALFGLGLAWPAWQRWRGGDPVRIQVRGWWVAAILLTIPALLCGGLAGLSSLSTRIVLPIAHPLAVVLPGLAVIALALAGEPGPSRLRSWVHLIGGAWGAVFIAIIIEVILGAVLLVGLIVLATIQPDWFGPLPALFEQIVAADGAIDIEPLITDAFLVELLTAPGVIAGLWLVVGLIAPLVEELFKPLGYWVLRFRGRPFDARTAFIGGVLGGLGYGLTESLLNINTAAGLWVMVVVLRYGTFAMHSFTSGLVALGAHTALTHKRPLRAVRNYLLAVALHSAWNTMAVVIAVGSVFLLDNSENVAAMFSGSLLVLLLVVGLLVLALGCFAGIFFVSRRVSATT